MGGQHAKAQSEWGQKPEVPVATAIAPGINPFGHQSFLDDAMGGGGGGGGFLRFPRRAAHFGGAEQRQCASGGIAPKLDLPPIGSRQPWGWLSGNGRRTGGRAGEGQWESNGRVWAKWGGLMKLTAAAAGMAKGEWVPKWANAEGQDG